MIKCILRAALAALALSCLPVSALAQSDQAERLSSIRAVAEAAYGGHEPGGAILVMKGGETLIAQGFGMADIEWQVPVGADTSFRVGSLSKMFTAVAVLRLVEAGKVDLDRPISTYLPNLAEVLGRPTVRQLLNHTSGLPDHFALPVVPSIMRNPIAPAGIVSLMAAAESDFEPGSRWSYSNFNYVLLGLLVEAVDDRGRAYDSYIEEEVFAPIGMVNSHFDRQSEIIPRRARGYDHDGTGPINTITAETSFAYASGALMSSVEDLARFTNALREHRLLGAGIQDQAWTAAALTGGGTTGYGLGFNVSPFMGEAAIWHNGSINGFQATWIHLPESDRTVAVLSNGYYRPNTTTSARRILALLAGEPVPDFTPTETPDEPWAEFAGRYRLENGQLLQIHVQDGVRYNLDGGSWIDLSWSGGDLFSEPDTLLHLRLHPAREGARPSLSYISRTLTRSQGVRLDGNVEGAEVALPMDVAEAARIAGNWAIDSGDLFVVAFDGDKLTLRLPGQPPQQLHRSAPGRYFVRGRPISFSVGPEAQSSEVNLYGNILQLRRQS